MSVVVVTPPAPTIDLALVKADRRVDHDDDDALIQAYIDAAVSAIDGPKGWLDRATWTQTLEIRQDRFCDSIKLPYGPVQSVTSIIYVDDDGAEQTLATSVYQVSGDEVVLAHDQSWPSLRGDKDGVRVRYVAGADEAPAAIMQALRLLVGQWYESREAVNVGNIVNAMPFAVDALLAPYRRWAI